VNKTSAPVCLPVPKTGNSQETEYVEGPGVFVFVGANGTGKTRLGSWIEMNSPVAEKVHRISAQKSLSMPPSVSPQSVERAQASLLWGYEQGNHGHRHGSRWGGNPNTSLLSDFDKLMVYLFSDDYEKSIAYRRGAFAESGRISPPETKLDIVKRLWENVLPHRQLIIGGGVIRTAPRTGGAEYSASEMSDGERVVFYLIGEALSAHSNGVLVVDEPELHLHKSVQAALWDAIEAEREDLTFVYLTHDLEFAASRVAAPKICLQMFDGANWTWYVAPPDTGLPEDVLLQIIGGRKHVLFVEGDETSLDYFFLRHVYPGANIVPAGSCDHVVHAVASFRSFEHLHQLQCAGLVDRDYRSDAAVAHLAARGVFVLQVAEIENALLGEPVLRVVAAELLREDADDICGAIKRKVFELLDAERERVASELAAARIEANFRSFNAKARGKQELTTALTEVMQRANAVAAYDEADAEVCGILDSSCYEGALRVYSNKGLLSLASSDFGLKPGEYVELLKRLCLSDRKAAFLAALREQMPIIEGVS
jgi:hypothetical protein